MVKPAPVAPIKSLVGDDVDSAAGSRNTAIADAAISPLVHALHKEGMHLLRSCRLTQRHPVTALQLHTIDRIVDPVLTGCGEAVAILTDKNGYTALEAARYRPHWQVTGWVPDMKSFLQLQTRKTPENVIFDKMPQSVVGMLQEKDSRPVSGSVLRPVDTKLKAILAPVWAHRKFSESHYHVSGLLQGLNEMLALLPDYGQIILQDFALPDDHEEFVTLEINNAEAADALIEFSKKARSNMAKPLQGFFVETLSSSQTGVKRFHLPCKWAVEFMHRWRLGIACDAPFELTTLSLPQFVSLVEQCGARVAYRAPHFLNRQQARALEQVMRFADAQGNVLPLPAESFTLVIEKLPQYRPLTVYERRVSDDKAKDIMISSLRHQESDQRLDMVEIRHHEDDVLPWYFDDQRRLHVLVRSHVPRPVINAVPRGTPNLDGRFWAGYLIEPVTISGQKGTIDAAAVTQHVQDLLGNIGVQVGKAKEGIEYYPAPEYLAQRVRGLFVPIQPLQAVPAIDLGENGRIIDVLAEDVLRAISAGLIPDGKLEILIARLMIEQGIQPVKTADLSGQNDIKRSLKIVKDKREIRVPRSIQSGAHLEMFVADDATENLRAVRSVFVQERAGKYGREIADMQEQDFIVPAALTTNTAVCIPVTKDPMGKFLLSGEPRSLPIPQRLGADEPMMHLPAFSLPFHVKTLDQARAFLAEQLQCNADDFLVMGPSFFVQSQISAERVYPFLLYAAPQNARWMRWFKPMTRGLRQLVMPRVEKTTAYLELKVARDLGEWYQGFTPDMTHRNTATHHTIQGELPLGASAETGAHLGRHPMVLPHMD